MARRARTVVLAGLAAAAAFAQTAENVLVVVNQSSNLSRRIGEYYVRKRQVPLVNLCRIKTAAVEEISLAVYENQIERPIAHYLKLHGLEEKILYIATTLGVPLKITGPGEGMIAEAAAVDSELTLLYSKLKGAKFRRAGRSLLVRGQARMQHSSSPARSKR